MFCNKFAAFQVFLRERIEPLDGVAGVLTGGVLRRRRPSRALYFFRICDFFGVPYPLLVSVTVTIAVSMFPVSVFSVPATLLSAVWFVRVFRATHRHLTVDVVAGDHLKLRVYVVSDETGIHFSRHIHDRAAELQFYAIAGRLTTHNLIPIHLLVVIVVRSQLGVVVEENISSDIVIVAVIMIWSSMCSRRPVAMCESCEKQ